MHGQSDGDEASGEAQAPDASRPEQQHQRRMKLIDDLLPDPDHAEELDLPPPDSTRLEVNTTPPHAHASLAWKATCSAVCLAGCHYLGSAFAD